MCLTMAKKVIASIIIMVVFFFSLILAIPIAILSDNFSDYGIIDESISFFYAPSNASSFEKLNINVDTGNIKIIYVDTHVPYHVKIDVNVQLGGSDLAGKSSLDFFNFIWLNLSSPVNYSMEIISDSWFGTSTLLTKIVNIIISIRKDIALGINATVNEGIIELTIPYGVSVKNIDLNINGAGDLMCNFYSCTIEGNVTGGVNEGYINFNSYNTMYTQSSILSLTLGRGDLDMNIDQYVDLGANVSGTLAINDGDVALRYDDNNDNVGARFEIPPTGNLSPEILCFGPYGSCPVEGFDSDDVNYIFTSYDLIARICNFQYNLTFELGDGIFAPFLTSL